MPIIHEQTLLTHPVTGAEVPVDAGLASLLSDLWRHGIETFMSCEDNIEDRVWINFADMESFCLFMEACAGDDPDSDVYHIVKDANDRWFQENKYSWPDGRVEGVPDGWWMNITGRFEDTGYVVYPHIRFPREHLAWVQEVFA